MATIVFLNQEFLFLLFAIPVLIVTHHYLFKFTKRKAMMFSNLKTLQRVTGKKIMTRNLLVLFLRSLVLLFVVLALAQPTIWYEGTEQRIDYVIAIDTSASMTANDLTPTRLGAAKQLAKNFVEELNTSAKIGVIGFSGVTTIEQIPTTDTERVKISIDSLSTKTVSGTDISQAIITGTNLLSGSRRGKAIILFSDGSNTISSFNNKPLTNGVRYALDNQVVVHTVGVGTPGSTPSGYLPSIYNITAVYNQEELSFIANQTSGFFIEARNNEELNTAYRSLLSDTRTSFLAQELYLGLLLLALLVLFVEWGLTNTRFRLIP